MRLVGVCGCDAIVETRLTRRLDDESMRSLMMAWYWAGYYTGLHEGQQKALQPQEQ